MFSELVSVYRACVESSDLIYGTIERNPGAESGNDISDRGDILLWCPVAVKRKSRLAIEDGLTEVLFFIIVISVHNILILCGYSYPPYKAS